MAVNDPIGDMIARIRNAAMRGRGKVLTPASKLREHLVFPEINYDEIDQVWGMDIIVCTTARSDDEARVLLKEFQFPFTTN